MSLTRLKPGAHVVPPQGVVREGDYRTDGQRLFRVGAPCGAGDRSLIEVEDCRTFDLWLLTTVEVAALSLVRPAAGLSAARGRAVAP